jgi:hypothetical protein
MESSMPYVGVNGGAPGAGGTVLTTVVGGINTISFVNQAYGQIEICKNIAAVTNDPSYNGTVFNFSVDSSPLTQPVAAGRCGQPQIVVAGSHTIKEVNLPYGFQFVSSAATGPTGDNRGAGTNPITVAVPWFADSWNGGETLVVFTNKVQRVQFKLCKLIEPGSLTAIGGKDYSWGWFDQLSNVGEGPSVTVHPPYPGAQSCTGLIGNVPIVRPGGAPNLITIYEINNGGPVATASVDVSNGTMVAHNFTPTANIFGQATFEPGTGVMVVTWTNKYYQPTT